MSVKDSLDLLIEQYFKASQSPETLNLGVLVEMIEETIGDSYPDIAAALIRILTLR
jgi:hypothetical protein